MFKLQIKPYLFFLILIVLVLIVQAAPAAGDLNQIDLTADSPVNGQVVPGRYIVLLADEAFPAAVAGNHGLTRGKTYRAAVNGFAAVIPSHKLAALRADPRVLRVESDRLYQVEAQSLTPGINRIEVDKVLPGITNNGVTVTVDKDIAIFDTGIDVNHPDLNVAGGYKTSFTTYDDQHGHGTHVAGIAAANDNDAGVVGVAPGARLWSIRVCNSSGLCLASEMIDGLDEVAGCKTKAVTGTGTCVMKEEGVDFASANMSIPTVDEADTCTQNSDIVHQAVCGLHASGVVLSISAGNSGIVRKTFPEALGVSAMADYDGKAGGLGSDFLCELLYGAPDDALAGNSNHGPDIDLAAPGICINSTAIGGGYQVQSGTSMAAPHAAGAVALYLEVNGLPPAQNGAEVNAIMQAIIDAALPQSHPCGYTNSKSNEPLLFVNGPAFGGDGSVDPCAPLNNPPTADDDLASTNEDNSVIVNVLSNDSDSDGNLDPTSVSVTAAPTDGTANANPDGTITYTPYQDIYGNDSFIYQVCDDLGACDTASVTVTINPLPDPPVAVNNSYFTDEDVSLNISAMGVLENDSDPDGDSLTAVLVTDVTDGNLTLNANGSFIYQPNLNFVGNDSFTYTANDGSENSNIAMVTITVDPVVDPPTIVDQMATAETAVAGIVSGTFSDSHTNDFAIQTITERESGGRKGNRYSYLEHKWTVSVQTGDAVTFFVNAWQSASIDGDNFVLAYSTDDSNYIDMLTVSETSDDDVYVSFMLPANSSGTIYIRVKDTDHSAGNRDKDTFYLDHMFIRSEVQSSGPPAVPTNLLATALSSSEIDLTWSDNADNESGFKIERSLDGSNWSEIDSVSTSQTSYSDTGLSAETLYYYRVRAFNGSADSAYSNIASETTQQESDPIVVDVGSIVVTTFNIGKGAKQGRGTVVVVDDLGGPVASAIVTGDFTGSFNEPDVSGPPTGATGTTVINTAGSNKGSVSLTFCVTSITHPILNDWLGNVCASN